MTPSDEVEKVLDYLKGAGSRGLINETLWWSDVPDEGRVTLFDHLAWLSTELKKREPVEYCHLVCGTGDRKLLPLMRNPAPFEHVDMRCYMMCSNRRKDL